MSQQCGTLGKKYPNVYIQTSVSLVRHVNRNSNSDLVTNRVVRAALGTILSKKWDQVDRKKREDNHRPRNHGGGAARNTVL